MLEIGGKTLIDRQLDLLGSVGVGQIMVVGGYQMEHLKAEGARLATLVSPRATLDFSRAIPISSHAILMNGGGGARRGVTIAESKSEPG